MAECVPGNSISPQCTAEDESENREQQATEIDMLQSIFEEQIVVLNSGEFMVKVTPRVDEKVSLLPLTPEDTSSHANEVSHLPEVTLYIKYPPSYPSHNPPECHLSARWMDSTVASAIQEGLRTRFEPYSPVVYEWILYLQDDMVRDYCQHSTRQRDRRKPNLVVSHENSEVKEGPRPQYQMFVRSTSLINDIEEYDKFEQFREFQSGSHDCGVCFNRVRGVDMCQPCSKCGLLYCKDCLSDYCKSCIGQSRMIVLECPASTCHAVLPDIYLKKILSEDFFQRYVMMRDKIELDSIPGMVFCPRCKSRTLSDPNSKVAVCDSLDCGFPFCKICQLTWHGPGKCPALDKVTLMQDGDDTDGSSSKSSNEEAKKRRLEELQSVLWVMSSKSVRQCPNCRSNIQKNGGCNKMVCSTCNSYFCWLCGKAISGYDHFDSSGNSSSKRCVLFRDEDYLPPAKEEDITGIDTLEEIEMVMRTKCPRCGRVEIKSSDNNWIKCYRCSFQYCHLCGEACFGLYHFNEYGCKKYSSLKEDVKLKKMLAKEEDAEGVQKEEEGDRGRDE